MSAFIVDSFAYNGSNSFILCLCNIFYFAIFVGAKVRGIRIGPKAKIRTWVASGSSKNSNSSTLHLLNSVFCRSCAFIGLYLFTAALNISHRVIFEMYSSFDFLRCTLIGGRQKSWWGTLLFNYYWTFWKSFNTFIQCIQLIKLFLHLIPDFSFYNQIFVFYTHTHTHTHTYIHYISII